MNTRWSTRLPLLAAAALALGLAACEPGAAPTEVSLDPHFARSGGALTLLRGAATKPEEASVWIDRKGGDVRAGNHILTVPRGAVDKPTLFTMQVLSSGYVDVELNAYQRGNGGLVRVGTAAEPFLQPVLLKLDYSLVTDSYNQNDLLIVYLPDYKPEGRLEARSSQVDKKGKRIHAPLEHFSRYAVGSGRVAR